MAKKRKRFIRYSRGGIITPLMLLALLFLAIFMVSNTLVNKSAPTGPNGNGSVLSCCDTGSGNDCKPQTGDGQKITFNGAEYGLLRTNTILMEGNVHLKDSGQQYNGQPIILNSSDTHIIPTQYATADCRTEPKDKYLKSVPPPPIQIGSPQSVPYCTSIPNDEIIYVCKKNCHAATCSGMWGPEVTCYGDAESQYDAYFRLSDVASPGVPDFIKNCDTSALPTGAATGGQQHIVTPTQQAGKKDNLQLKTFQIQQDNLLVPWLSPFCKPAIYLYPENTTPVNVKINPAGPIKLTIPDYPTGGWNVIAHPDGTILSGSKNFDYLYYEAEIPDEKIEKPNEGFVVKKDEIKALLSDILPRLGLNDKEKNQFVDYWNSVLPNAPYYFVGVIPVANLDAISPLYITPKPTTTIRITLYFEALDTPISVTSPTLTSIARNGFTMVEWGGIFKKSDKYPFSCFQ